MIAPRASLIEFPGSRNRVTYGGYGQFSCVREREHPCVLRFLALAVQPRRFTVPWFVHIWCLPPATAAALTIRARHVCHGTHSRVPVPLGEAAVNS